MSSDDLYILKDHNILFERTIRLCVYTYSEECKGIMFMITQLERIHQIRRQLKRLPIVRMAFLN